MLPNDNVRSDRVGDAKKIGVRKDGILMYDDPMGSC